MKKALFILVCLFATPAFAQNNAVQMATESSFHGDEIDIENNSDVLVFGKEGKFYALKKNSVHIENYEDPIADDDITGKKTGKVVALKQKVEGFSPEIILKADFLKEGPLETGEIYQNCLSENENQPCHIRFKNQTYEIHIDNKLITDSDTVETIYQYDLTIRDKAQSSKITSAEYHINSIYWAGDLDRDGKIDLITRGDGHYNVHVGYMIYLSSLAKKGELFGFAGVVSGVGC